MFTLVFWKAVLERSAFSFLEALTAVLLTAGVTTLTGVDWVAALNVAALAGVIALIKNILVAKATDGSPSLTNAEHLNPS